MSPPSKKQKLESRTHVTSPTSGSGMVKPPGSVFRADILSQAANEARGLAMDAVAQAKSGHLGIPLGCAEIGAVLFGHTLRFNPADPKWLNRDRFVLSAGHGSMFLYAWLHISGFDVDLPQIKQFRSVRSRTPGHPEFNYTPGVEATTGPLGQGVANAVGYAVSQKMAAARFNTPAHRIFDNRVVCLCGDGCMQEGVAMEALAYAGHVQLDNLILIYDNNLVTLDAMAVMSQSEDTGKRFEAIGWAVQVVDGHDLFAFRACIETAYAAVGRGKPQLIIAKTVVGKGIPEVSGTDKAHGESGAKYVVAARKGLGLPDERFYVSPETKTYFAKRAEMLAAKYDDWQHTLLEWKQANPALGASLDAFVRGHVPNDLCQMIPLFGPEDKLATRKAGAEVLATISAAVPNFITGSADLASSCMNVIEFAGHFSASDYSGRNLHFGVREHGMAGILNGIAYDGIFRPSGSTFMVFSDYCRASIRVAALSQLPTLFIFTHDSVGVGEDGPTHQPVETVSSLRLLPNLDVIRPADPEETAAAFAAAMQNRHGPTVLSLTRQVVPNLNEIPAQVRREGVYRGGYVAIPEVGPLQLILLSCGSELHLAVEAARRLHSEGGVRVVSMPSFFRFNRQPRVYRDSVLPPSCRKRVAVEAGVRQIWWQFVGLDGAVVGVKRYGLSGPASVVLQTVGVTVEAVVQAAQGLLHPSAAGVAGLQSPGFGPAAAALQVPGMSLESAFTKMESVDDVDLQMHLV